MHVQQRVDPDYKHIHAWLCWCLTVRACRTAHQPSMLAASHLVSLARTAWQTLSQLLLLGADAPIAQQQLTFLQQQQQDMEADSKKRSKQQQNGIADGMPDDAALHNPSEELQYLEACALGRTWRVLCAPALTGFDALILLRKEGLPFADRSDPLAVQQLQLLLAQQHRQQRRLAGGKKQQQQHGVVQLLLGGGGSGGVKCAAPKNARAILRSIPEQVCRLCCLKVLRLGVPVVVLHGMDGMHAQLKHVCVLQSRHPDCVRRTNTLHSCYCFVVVASTVVVRMLRLYCS
jgi:hypothetical protein